MEKELKDIIDKTHKAIWDKEGDGHRQAHCNYCLEAMAYEIYKLSRKRWYKFWIK